MDQQLSLDITPAFDGSLQGPLMMFPITAQQAQAFNLRAFFRSAAELPH
jgi:hypothetical protein